VIVWRLQAFTSLSANCPIATSASLQGSRLRDTAAIVGEALVRHGRKHLALRVAHLSAQRGAAIEEYRVKTEGGCSSSADAAAGNSNQARAAQIQPRL
jgi:hypothetical protein